jgi:hypothetical protein
MAISETPEMTLRLAARRAYELGRLRGSLRMGAVAAGLALPGLLYCRANALAAICFAGLALVVIAGRIRGEGYEEGVRVGLLAGVLPCLIPAALHIVNPAACAALYTNRPWLCAAGGVAAGVILGLISKTAEGLPFWASAIVALGFASALGCIPAGALGFAGLVLGVIAGSAPVLAVRRSFS